jgi:hypothetical protein
MGQVRVRRHVLGAQRLPPAPKTRAGHVAAVVTGPPGSSIMTAMMKRGSDIGAMPTKLPMYLVCE